MALAALGSMPEGAARACLYAVLAKSGRLANWESEKGLMKLLWPKKRDWAKGPMAPR